MILSAVIRNKRFGNHGREHAEFEFAAGRYGARLRDKTTSLLTNFSTFTKVARAKIIQASISFPMRCHLVGSGTVNRTQATTQNFAADHMTPLSAFTMTLAT
jgi:hypothetical protein